mgnify:FL=1|tara:strand:- start:973 stop:1296 length:324 start_codon:yes stop_codon:yes gene_type:complete
MKIQDTPVSNTLRSLISYHDKAIGSTDGIPEDEKSIMSVLTSDMMRWSWTIHEAEFQGDDMIFFGRVNGFASELGYFSWEELAEVPDLRIESRIATDPEDEALDMYM